MDDRVPEIEELLSRALDGELSDAERARIEKDPALSERLASMRRTDERIRALYPPAEPPKEFPVATNAPKKAPPPWRNYAGLAAIVALSAVLWVMNRPPAKEIEAARLYDSITLHMSPEHVCSTAPEFETYSEDYFGVTITASFDTPVELIGWRGLWGQYRQEGEAEPGRILLARSAEGEPVLVFFVRSKIDRPSLPDESGLRVHSKRLGAIAVHEVSRLDAPVVLDLLSRVEAE